MSRQQHQRRSRAWRAWAAAVLSAASALAASAPLADLPQVPAGMKVEVIAREPLVRNPCAMAFDARGRLFVGHGPQYRNPKPDTPPDSVVILIDRDGDGVADETKVFATGFNCIQGLSWHGRDLWVANSPDLTIVRDLDGDDVADEFVRVYTDLGNIEHGIHGLHWAPDGKLYFTKGNSKGLTQPGRIAPKPFRELWDVRAPDGTPDFPPPQTFKPAEYRRTYHDPRDDWGREGGQLRCDDLGANLEIVARGLRNPFDVGFDAEFDWLGMDNDQSEGDRIVMPFRGAHFGWGHRWSPHWTGEGHAPTVPVSGPTFDGSGTGVAYYELPQMPAEFRGVWFMNDFLRKTTFVYRPIWDGARMMPQGGTWEEFARGGDALYKPVDLRIGPDGALYVTGWGQELDAVWRDGQQTNEGRVFRISWTQAPRREMREPHRELPVARWTFAQLAADLGSPVEGWRSDAQNELVRRGATVKPELLRLVARGGLGTAEQTWALWTLGRIGGDDPEINGWLEQVAARGDFNQRLQALRIAVHRIRFLGARGGIPAFVSAALSDREPRLRCAAVLAIAEARDVRAVDAVCALLERETDRVTYYAGWQALRALEPAAKLRGRLTDARAGVRRGALLALLESGALERPAVEPLLRDPDAATAELAGLWVAKQNGNPLIVIEPAPGVFSDRVRVKLTPGIKPGAVRYTSDGSEPTLATRSNNAIEITDTTTLKIALFVEGKQVGRTVAATWRKRTASRAPEPTVLTPPKEPTQLEAVLSRWPSASATRGRAVFHAAGCVACHRVGEEGTAVGPDLTGFGDRGDPTYLVRSMLEPDAAITEGFALVSVTTNDGAALAGILAEESDRALTLTQPNGERVTIEKARIARRASLHRSIMPSFANVLGAEPMADLVAWLMSQHTLPRTQGAPASTAPLRTGFSWELKADRLVIAHAGERVADFVFKDAETLRPHFQNIVAPGGVSITRRHPPVAPEATDHAALHPGLWFAFGDINGADFWRNKARIERVGFVAPPAERDGRLTFATDNRLIAADGELLGTQRLTFALWRDDRALWIDCATELRGDRRELVFGDQEEMGLGVRVTAALTEKAGDGAVLNSDGVRGAKAAWSKVADWCEYAAARGERRAGVAIFADPRNPQRSWWHTRDYGLMVANAFGARVLPAAAQGKIVVPEGSVLRLHYIARFFNEPTANAVPAADLNRGLFGP